MSTTPVRTGGTAGEAGPSSDKDNALMTYLAGVRYELEAPRTVWPTRAELFQMTRVVLVILFVVAVYCGALDGVLSFITDRIFTH